MRQALLIGQSLAYTNSQKNVPAHRLTRALDDFGGVLRGFPEPYAFRVQVLVDEPWPDVDTAITKATHELDDDDVLLIYYMGHAFIDEDGKLRLPAPEGPKKAAKRAAEANATRGQALDALIPAPAKAAHQWIVLDCCYGGHATRDFSVSHAGHHATCCLMASATPTEKAHVEYKDREAPIGAFTGALMEALLSSDSQESLDSRLVIDQKVFAVAAKLTRERSRNVQNPVRVGNLGQPITEYHRRPSIAVTDAGTSPKSAYRKLRALCEHVDNRRPASTSELLRVLERAEAPEFLTGFKTGPRRVEYQMCGLPVVERYVDRGRVLALVQRDVIALTAQGRSLLAAHRRDDVRRYNSILLDAVNAYLAPRGLTDEALDDILREIVARRSVPTGARVRDELAQRGNLFTVADIEFLLDILAGTGVIQVVQRRVFFAW